MAEQINDGGQAFPTYPDCTPEGKAVYAKSGMSLRAWLAGMALQGELASQSSMAGTWKTQDATKCVARCITFADALIAELQKPEDKP